MEVISNRDHTRRCIPEWKRRGTKKKNIAKSLILEERIHDCCSITWSWQHWWSQKLWYWKICSVSWKKLYIEWQQNEISFLVCLFKLILSLPDGNSAPENCFSLNKLLLEIHDSSLKKEIIEVIRIVKDSFLKYESILDIPVTKEMISMVSTSRQLYMDHLEQKRKEEEKAKEVKCWQKWIWKSFFSGAKYWASKYRISLSPNLMWF